MISLYYVLGGLREDFAAKGVTIPQPPDNSSAYVDFPLGGKCRLEATAFRQCFEKLFPGYELDIPTEPEFTERFQQAVADGHRYMCLRVIGCGIQIDATALVAHGLANITLAQWDLTTPGCAPDPQAT